MRSSNAIALIRHLRLEGVSIWADQQGNIHVMPAILTPDDREVIRAGKADVVAYLRRYAVDMLPDDTTLRQWQSEVRGSGPSAPVASPVRKLSDNEVTTPPPRMVAGERPAEHPAQVGERPKGKT